MSQEQHNMDWQKKLEEQKAPLDVQQFWNKLEPQLPPQKKRRILAWWLWPTLLLFGAGVATTFYVTNGGVTYSNSEPFKVENKEQTKEVLTEQDIRELQKQDLGGSPAEIELTKGTSSAGKNKGTLSDVNKTLEFFSQSKKMPLEGQVQKADQLFHDLAKEESGIATMENRKMAQSQIRMDLPTKENGNNQNYSDRVHRQGVSMLPQGKRQFLSIESVSLLPGFMASTPPPAGKAWTWAISLAGGPGVGLRQLTSSDPASQSWIEQRNLEERVLESWQIRGMAEVVHPSGWLLETGLQWTRQNERLDWSQDSMNWAWGLGEGLLVDPNGGTQPWSDSTWNSYSLTRTVRHYNQISTLELPIGAGYQINRGRWSVRATVGALINLRQTASGRSIHKAQWPVYWEGPFGPKLKTKLGIGAYGNAQLSYQLQSKMSAFIQPSFTFYPDDRQVGSTYSLKYNQANLLVGLRWNLN